MNRLLISYDLVSPGRNYEDLYNYLTAFLKKAKPLESVWVVKTDKNHNEVKKEITKYLDSNDKLLVIDITGSASSWYNIPAKDWIKNNE